ncbi:phenylacetate-CoA ligase [Croceifilum oryzae]|uniref:Phenylacetate-CoA ligase n=1 Tax=Croceifilum oryzae TaxID=1553429 RepID=A0AAJ1WUG5_9BACL|nr:hypothetical protein [Croceifilum oryzae]MDQ0417971.1 phenylacetate-CoA ligase [Croceifilum oryzae]
MSWNMYQDKVLDMVRFAKENSPFYSAKYAAVDLQHLTEAEFHSLPIIRKSDLLGNERQLLVSAKEDDLSIERTSGTTGAPLICYKSKKDVVMKGMDLWKLRKKWGDIAPSDRRADFYLYYDGKQIFTDNIYTKDSQIHLSPLDMSKDSLNRYYEALIQFDPAWIYAPASAIYIFADHLLEQGLDASRIKSLRYIECAGEMLFDYQREKIEKVFGPLVHSMYGTKENWCIAMSCNKGSLHLQEDRYYIEVINSNEEGTGELVVTDLQNKTWPLIRYWIGDLVSVSAATCDCGQSSPVLTLTGGRTQEYVQVHDWLCSPVLFHYRTSAINRKYGNCIRSFRVTQRAEEDFLIELVPGTDYNESIAHRLTTDLLEWLPQGVRLELELHTHIDFKNNKFTYFQTYKRQQLISSN